MDDSEYRREYHLLKEQFHNGVAKLHTEYVQANARFKVGDFVGNVLGIIKVSKVYGSEPVFYGRQEGDAPVIKYKGFRYKKLKGKLLRTKHSKQDTIADYGDGSLSLIKVSEVDGEIFYKRNSGK